MADEPLTDLDELLLRQVHPSFIHAGRPSSQAFRPTREHDFRLSVSRGSKTTPERAYKLHIGAKGLLSGGVWAVTVGEGHNLDLNTYDDPVVDAVPDPAHAVIDFSQRSSREMKRDSQLLARYAHARGCLYAES